MVQGGWAPGPTGRCTTARGSRRSHPCLLTFPGLPSLPARGTCEICIPRSHSAPPCKGLGRCCVLSDSACLWSTTSPNNSLIDGRMHACSGQMVLQPSLAQRRVHRAAMCMKTVKRSLLPLRTWRMGIAQAGLQMAEMLSSFQVRP